MPRSSENSAPSSAPGAGPVAASAPAAPVLSVERLRKTYGRTVALDDVSLSVPRGCFAVLLGPNGAGKTTLFNLATALFHPDGGRVLIGGFDTARKPVAALASVGVVFQQQTLDASLTVQQNLIFHADLHGIKSSVALQRIAEQAERIGISDRLHDPVHKLNGGHRRRVELIRALLHEPALLLLDEPTAGLDIGTRNLMHAHIRSLCRDTGVSVLWATHMLEEVSGADAVHVLFRGRFVYQGDEPGLLAATDTADLHQAFAALTSGNKAP
jgi:ABC-2 type transport system ATP-binding protein